MSLRHPVQEILWNLTHMFQILWHICVQVCICLLFNYKYVSVYYFVDTYVYKYVSVHFDTHVSNSLTHMCTNMYLFTICTHMCTNMYLFAMCTHMCTNMHLFTMCTHMCTNMYLFTMYAHMCTNINLFTMCTHMCRNMYLFTICTHMCTNMYLFTICAHMCTNMCLFTIYINMCQQKHIWWVSCDTYVYNMYAICTFCMHLYMYCISFEQGGVVRLQTQCRYICTCVKRVIDYKRVILCRSL